MCKIDVNKIMISNKFSRSKNDCEYFISYKNDNKVRLLSAMLPELNEFVNNFKATKSMNFLNKD